MQLFISLLLLFGFQEKIDKQQFLDEVNEIRKQGCMCGDTQYEPAQPVIWNDALQKASELHSKDMKINNYFAHFSKQGKSPADRAKAQKYIYTHLAENLFVAHGYIPTPKEVVLAWKNSVTHCKNLMNPNVKEMGLGTYKGYYTQLFGAR